MSEAKRYILTLDCPDRSGIVAATSTYLADAGFNILESQQYDDPDTQRFFMRVVFAPVSSNDPSDPSAGFAVVAERFSMRWRIRDAASKPSVVILTSKFDHCLIDLLYRVRIGELRMRVAAVISNHPREAFGSIDLGDVPFMHLPVVPETKLEQEARLWSNIRELGADLVVLARYMQILSDALTAKILGRCLNIHHSFLPGFKGAKPYHQAHRRGVKLIGATAHFVTSDLDEGPIVEQDVERISHADTPEDLIRKGRDIERRVLASAVRFFIEDRVFLNGNKTVVFR